MKSGAPSLTRLQRLRYRLFAAGLGAVLGLTTVLVALAWLGPEPLPEITNERLEQAMLAWKQQRPSDYLIEVTVQGPQPGTYLTEVRDGKVVVAHRNGHSLNTRRVTTTWTVEGMFRTLDYDLRSQQGLTKNDAQLSVRAIFDSQYGYPAKYHRIQWGSLHELTWEVTRFEVFARTTEIRDGSIEEPTFNGAQREGK